MAIRPRMSRHSAAVPDRASTLSFWLLVAFLAILWVAGGASRADVLGQSVVRFSAWSIIVVAILALPRVDWRAVKEPAIILGAAALLVALQLVPLPPAIWTELPGRAIFTEAAVLTGTEQPWRPLSISPSGTSNALASLVVPTVVVLLAANLTREQHWRIAVLLLALVGAGALLGVLQFSGAHFDNPLINTQPRAVAGNFANRNHFALFLAIGCVLSVAWALRENISNWKAAAGFCSLTFFVLLILATGSRSGIILGFVGCALVLIAYRGRLTQKIKTFPTRTSIGLLGVAAAVLIAAIWLSVSLERAESFNRVEILSSAEDLRWNIWPVAFEMTQLYFPFGAGFGSFDPVFRIHEPASMLSPQYINLAHNDWLQIVLEGGLFGGALLGGVLIWFFWRAILAWSSVREKRNSQLLARSGSILLSLIFIASVTDYPPRTPMVMAMLPIAAIWLTNFGLIRKVSSAHPSARYQSEKY